MSVCLLALLPLACASGATGTSNSRMKPASGEKRAALPHCPMRVPGAELTSFPIAGGTALVFTTSEGSVEELRLRARNVLETYDADRAADSRVRGPGWRATPLEVPTKASFREVLGGARIDIRAVYERDVGALREHLTRRAEAMRRSGDCPRITR